MIFSTIINGEKLDLNIVSKIDEIQILNKSDDMHVDCVTLSDDSFSLILNGQIYYLTILPELDGYEVLVNHHPNFVQVKNKFDVLIEQFGLRNKASDHSGEILAQIPGLVSRIEIQLGEKVKVGDTLCILEAMKMENEIKSPKNGIIKKINVNSGTNVEKGDLLMEISN